MKIPISWLKEYVDFDATPEEIGDKLTFSGMELEGIDVIGGDYEGFIVGEVTEIKPHPNADRLRLCRVNNGSEEVAVVCGASNFNVGDKAAFAPAGVKLPGGTKIRKAKVRGEESFGMLCAEDELGLSEDHDGIMVLDPALEAGTPLSEVLGPPEPVLDMEITWNRADCLSIIGVAREIAALYGTELKLPAVDIAENDTPVEDMVAVNLEDPDGCPRYTARYLSGIEVGQSPMWMKKRLSLCGIRPINNIVDITNYVLLECGQPLHAFDYDRLAGSSDKVTIGVRRASEGEKMNTLDEQEHEISAQTLLITDTEQPVALAGVMGGAGSEILDESSKVLLESAFFDPPSVRAASVALGVSTESSHRFERGVDISGVEWASARAAALMVELAGGTAAKGVVDVYPVEAVAERIKCSFDRVRTLMGVDISDEEMTSILESLGIEVTEREGSSFTAVAPLCRLDLKIEADIIEEIARMHGIDEVPAHVPSATIVPEADDSLFRAFQTCREKLTGLGLFEIMHYSFHSKQLLKLMSIPEEDCVILPNPVSEDHSVMRPSLMPQMAETLGRNHSHQVDNAILFEIGRTFFKGEGGVPSEAEKLCIGMMGNCDSWRPGQPEAVDPEQMFFMAKGVIEGLCSALNLSGLRFNFSDSPCMEKGAAVSIEIDGEKCGIMGLLSPDVTKQWRITGPVAIAEISMAQLVANVGKQAELSPIPAYPAISRDIAILMKQSVTHEAVMDVIRKSAPPELTDVKLFDIYTGEGIGVGNKSVAYSLKYRSLERTLTDEDANGYHEKIKDALKNELKVEIR